MPSGVYISSRLNILALGIFCGYVRLPEELESTPVLPTLHYYLIAI